MINYAFLWLIAAQVWGWKNDSICPFLPHIISVNLNVSCLMCKCIINNFYLQIFFTAMFAYLLIDTSTLDSVSDAPHYIQVFGSMLMCLPFAYYLLIQTITHFKLGRVRQLSIIMINNSSSSANLMWFLFSPLER